MSKALNWRRAQIASKRKTSIADEQEYRGRDAAARWLERKPTPRRPSRQGAGA